MLHPIFLLLWKQFLPHGPPHPFHSQNLYWLTLFLYLHWSSHACMDVCRRTSTLLSPERPRPAFWVKTSGGARLKRRRKLRASTERIKIVKGEPDSQHVSICGKHFTTGQLMVLLSKRQETQKNNVLTVFTGRKIWPCCKSPEQKVF